MSAAIGAIPIVGNVQSGANAAFDMTISAMSRSKDLIVPWRFLAPYHWRGMRSKRMDGNEGLRYVRVGQGCQQTEGACCSS